MFEKRTARVKANMLEEFDYTDKKYEALTRGHKGLEHKEWTVPTSPYYFSPEFYVGKNKNKIHLDHLYNLMHLKEYDLTSYGVMIYYGLHEAHEWPMPGKERQTFEDLRRILIPKKI